MTDGYAVRRAQELAHAPGHDYAVGSPHIEHPELHAWIVQAVRRAVLDVAPPVGRVRVLEIGAGHGTFTAQLVAAGADIVVTEMSRASAAVLQERFAGCLEVDVVHDPDGECPVDGVFDAVVYLSVLHHIPDYLTAVESGLTRLRLGGSFVSFQDPLWYSRRSSFSRLAAWAVYLSWRLRRGDLGRGATATIRRALGGHDERELADIVEYHVVRAGVDELALQDLLRPRFADVRLIPYWSTQSALGQRWGSGRLAPNTFGCVASGFRASHETE